MNFLNTETVHPDDIAVDQFAAVMKAKLAQSRAKRRSGWDDKSVCTQETLQKMLVEHLAKGDPVDVGNFAMMLFNRGESTAPLAQTPPLTACDGPLCGAPEFGGNCHPLCNKQPAAAPSMPTQRTCEHGCNGCEDCTDFETGDDK